MSYLDLDDEQVRQPQRKPKIRKCKRCKTPVVPDGHGELIHTDGVDEMASFRYGCPVFENDRPVFIRPADARFADVAV